MAQYSLAFDFGATSIRAILGAVENGRFVTTEVMRMSHQRVTEDGRSRWEWDKIVNKVVETIKAHAHEISSIAVNTWGVDFGVVGEDGKLLVNPISYRDARHNEGFEYAQETLSQEQIFMATGNQIMSINSLFQLLVLKKDSAQGCPTYNKINKLLMLPDLLNYLLTGQQRAELTIASTSQLLDLRTKKFAEPILQAYGIKESIFAPIVYPTEVVGSIKDSLIPELRELNKDIKVIACASHDTASAVLLTEAYTDRDTAFLSCGTWSLIGGLTDEPVISKEAFARDLTNETGFAGSNMFFKNITGLYILEMLKNQLEAKRGAKIPFDEITAYVENCPVDQFVDVGAEVFAQNEFDVKEAINSLLGTKFENDFDYFKVIYLSLAKKYHATLQDIETILQKKFKKLHMIGGGTQSKFLCQLVSNVTGLEVIAGPMEATAYGNLLAQKIALKEFDSLEQGRKVILDSSEFKVYHPQV
ncbi:FGGY family carbohydrate kinase [Anaerobiospirillum sp. NML120448]|uniref:rhamnulokinase n=1 Tax=Anaerobiospirillum sp. NML120448 TaxID=2932816 RepID=UPI001FF0E941|nr:FGGY family carbohydrate kinase [Anaerobiospirillum sp. NML120448]MCK0513630.1 FGGY family carbohydrate kinase [Anaerobiospirillum sp. NML120448]